MATADPNNMQLLYRRLKQEFPDIPESVILSCINRYPNDLPTCIAILNQQRSAYQYAPINKQDKDHFNHYETTRPYPIVHGPVQMQQQQQPYRYTGQKSYPGDPIPSDYNPIRRNTLTPATANRGYHRPANQPQSAPVVPNMYQPFHAEYPAKLSPRAGSHHPQQPPTYSVNDYMNQYDQYKYEVALNYNQALVVHQRAQMDRLQQKLNEDRLKLDVIRQQVSHMELELYNRIKALKHPAIFNPDDMKKLREETRKLRVECDCMSREVDFLVKGQVPLGETSEDFYKHINPGQSGSIGTPPSSSGSMNRRPSASPIISNRRQEQEEEGRQWGCSQCTFLNNPALDKCEMCEMPRLSIAADFG